MAGSVKTDGTFAPDRRARCTTLRTCRWEILRRIRRSRGPFAGQQLARRCLQGQCLLHRALCVSRLLGLP